MFTKQYNGKLDRVALYQSRKTYWDKKPYLSNMPVKSSIIINEELKTEVKYNFNENFSF